MTDEKKAADTAADKKPQDRVDAEELRDLEVLDSRIENVKGGATRHIRRKRTLP